MKKIISEQIELEHLTNHSFSNAFNTVAEQAKQIEQNWSIVYDGIYERRQHNEDLTHLKQLDDDFRAALQQLNYELTNPTLILATTGTTSSGKSSIVNLLCGADIMPRMAQEMSAGVVYINHSQDGKRHLKICETEGAAWKCGEWHDLTDAEIQQRLKDVMETFNKLKGMGQPATPYIELTYPIACFEDNSLLKLSSLPKTTQFKIMDLPGLRNQQDNTNKDDIKNCRNALCIVAYNMEETDDSRRKALVQEVLQQVKQMGGSPVRMFFALNRIDVFRKDPDWERHQREHIDKTNVEIKAILSEGLPEHGKAISNLSSCPLSSLPALYARRMKESDCRIQAADELDEHFNCLIPRSLLSDLPRNPAKWEEQDFHKVSQAVWQSSYAEDFFSSLDQHIQNYFPTLVIPSIVQRFKDEGEKSINEAIRICNSEINGTTENYEAFKVKLYEQNAQLRQFFSESMETLRAPFEELLKKSPLEVDDLRLATEKLNNSEPYHTQFDGDALTPLYHWEYSFRRMQFGILRGVIQSLDSGVRDFSGTEAEFLPDRLQQQLDYACAAYNKKADTVGTRLERFVEKVNYVFGEALNIQSTLENQRIHDALETLLAFYLAFLHHGIQDIAPEWGLSIGHSDLKELPTPKITATLLQANTETKTYDERIWWSLWLAKRTISYQDVPSTKSIDSDWSAEILEQIDGLVEPFVQKIVDYIKELEVQITRTQMAVLTNFEAKLEAAHRNNTDNYQTVLAIWQPLKEQTEQCKTRLQYLIDGKEYDYE